jgi:Mce-associated membrane protein
VPPRSRIPSNPPRRRPKVAGLSRRGLTGTTADTPADTPADTTADTPADTTAGTSVVHPAPAVIEHWGDEPDDRRTEEARSDEARTGEGAGLRTDAEARPDDAGLRTDTEAPADDAGLRTDTKAPSEDADDTDTRDEADTLDDATDDADADADADQVDTAADTAERGRRGKRLAGVLVVVLLLLVTVVFGVAAAIFRGQAARAAVGSSDNRALVDNAATSEVVGQVSKDIETVLSYDYTKLDENERAAGQVITGKYRDEFAKTFADVRRTAPEQKLVLNTTVLLAGVTVLNGDRAEVIATMDLAAMRDTTPFNSPGRVKVVAAKVDGRWKIAEMTLL